MEADLSPDTIPPDQIDATFSTTYTDLVSAPLNPRILHVTDEFFCAAANLFTPTPPISRPGVFVETGAWYDGWETRRHNRAASDSVVVRLGVAAGRVRGVEVDTAHFTGNHAPAVSVEGCCAEGEGADAKVVREGFDGWQEVLPRRNCAPSRRHAWKVGEGAPGSYGGEAITHVRLRMYPDGGIARFRLWGDAVPVWPEGSTVDPTAAQEEGDRSKMVELSATQMGGVAVASSDQHYGKAANLLLPGRGKDMGDGWETKRSRAPGHVDWAIVRLGAPGVVGRVVIDTMHFRGNFPSAVEVALGCFEKEAEDGGAIKHDDAGWKKVAYSDQMKPDTEFEFEPGKGLDVSGKETWTHAKVTMIPDGGLKRFRVFGWRVAK